MATKIRALIIGAGIQGMALAAKLKHRGLHDFLLLDPWPLGGRWRESTLGQNIKDLRTPYRVHCSPLGTSCLLDFAARKHRLNVGETEAASLHIFNDHLRWLAVQLDLERHHIAGWANSVNHVADGYEVTAQVGNQEQTFHTQHLIVATGLGKPVMLSQDVDTHRVMHASQVNIHALPKAAQVSIIGGGLTAATLAVECVKRNMQVAIHSRSVLSVSQLEADPEWAPEKPRHRDWLSQGYETRAKLLKEARADHGITPGMWQQLNPLIKSGKVKVHQGAVLGWSMTSDRKIAIPFSNTPADLVICSTGFEAHIADLGFLRTMGSIPHHQGIPLVNDGFESLTFRHLYFMGRLGELAGGPLSRNIPGAVYAAKKIATQIL